MAIGDSITVGYGMKSGRLPLTTPTEYRRDVFDIGGDSGQTAIPNFLESYRPSIAGAATGTIALYASIDVLDAAHTGDHVQALVGQIGNLVSAFNSGGYNTSGWKMLGVLIGANDVCESTATTQGTFESSYRAAMQALRGNFTNMIVNAYTLFDVTQVYIPRETSSYCKYADGILNLCPCVSSTTGRSAMQTAVVQYNAAIQAVAAEFQSYNDFIINVQPGISTFDIPQSADGLNWLAQIDCFHPNLCMNQVVAGALWNNIFQPAWSKQTYQLQANSIYCPGPTEYFQ